ncbi:hypothetical protein TI39_contig4106g00011 [Zymoseptoria brevis]|uniref:GH16 domain-containing protein n=1 Tax=Zymoseptoria brevis TaxID=1047168 RepID=A0A0F4GDN9_9PEZI|nr:hypothetical protein TI39_contig4106g00011 [Zymoseptoria brevis]
MRALVPLLAAVTFASALQDCSCGYMVNTTDQEYHAVFTEIFETDFLHVGDLKKDTGNSWLPQKYDYTAEASHGPYGKAARVENVKTNPLHNAWDWTGPGIHGQDLGLQLWTKDNFVDISGNSMIRIAEVVSTRDDILYGSFRIGLKTSAVNGTCGGFFFYLNEPAEIEMEFLSSTNQKSAGFVHLVVPSEEDMHRGYIKHDSPNVDAHSLIFSPTTDYNEFRFDWLPDRIDFYANGERLSTVTDDVPDSPGSLRIIHWSTGDDDWSGGPPKEDAVMTVSYVKAYFNSPEPDNTQVSLMSCQDSLGGEHACRIPDQLKPPGLLGPNGNQTAQTHFFQRDMSELMVTPASIPPKHRPTRGSERRYGSGNGGVLYWAMAIAAGLFTFHGFNAFRLLHVGLRIRAP